MMQDLYEFLASIIQTAWSMLDSSSTWVIFSFIVAGLLHEFIKPEQMQKTAIGSKKFTGVYRLYTATLFKGSDIYVDLAGFEIKEGNFAFYVVFDGEVIGKIEPDDFATAEFTLENVEKTASLEYFIAGESASFEFIAPTGWD